MRRTAVSRPRRGMSRALTPVAAAALVCALATGCSDDGDADSEADGDASEAAAVALTEEQVPEAVLQEENLGEGWASTPSPEDDSVGPGCFGDIDALTEGLQEKAKVGTEFAYGDAELPFVESSVTSYEDETAIAAVFDQVQVILAACSTVADTDEDGVTWDLTMAYDDAATFDVDDQFHASASGTLTQPERDPFEIYIEWTSVRVGPNVGTVATIDTQERPTEHSTWTEIAVDRLDAVAHGEEPEATTAPAPA